MCGCFQHGGVAVARLPPAATPVTCALLSACCCDVVVVLAATGRVWQYLQSWHADICYDSAVGRQRVAAALSTLAGPCSFPLVCLSPLVTDVVATAQLDSLTLRLLSYSSPLFVHILLHRLAFAVAIGTIH